MRRVLILCLLSGCAPPPVPAPPTPWERVQALKDQDLLALYKENPDGLRAELCRIGIEPSEKIGFFPDRITRLSDRWVIFWLQESGKFPGIARARAVVLDDSGRILSDSEFTVGWRICLEGAYRDRDPEAKRELLAIHSQAAPNGRCVNRQYFALDGNRLELVRLEGAEGYPVRNIYASPNHTIGPLRVPESEDDCLETLRNGSWAGRMSLLTWLGGIHWDGNDPEVWHEEKERAERAQRLQGSSRVREEVRKWTESDDPWMREAAQLVLE